MGKYFVEVQSGGETTTIPVEAYSPVEAAFIAGTGVGVTIGLLGTGGVLSDLTAEDAGAEIMDIAQQELSGVLVREERYVNAH